jgi:hypothetical protein
MASEVAPQAHVHLDGLNIRRGETGRRRRGYPSIEGISARYGDFYG